MVEAAVIFPVMALFLVMLELAHHSFDAYITVGHVAAERTWSSVTTGSLYGKCPAGRDDTSYVSQVKYFTIAGSTNTDVQPGTQTPPSAGPASVPSPSLGGQNGFWKHTADATATVNVSRGSRSFTNNPKSSDTVYCNQKYYGSLLDIIKNAL